MLNFLCATIAMTRAPQSTTWYGPAIATFPVQFSGNPFDPAENDVRVRFTDKRGKSEERIAFFNEPLGAWQAILVTKTAGSYKAALERNGKEVPGADKEGTLSLDKRLEHGFIHPDPTHHNRFIWDDGTPEVPIGFDLGWQDNRIIPITEQLAKMGASGINWSRIWACTWDGKNPWWPTEHQKLAPETLWSPALEKWDQIEKAAERSKVSFQMVLFHHGEFSSQVDPNWPDNPWNKRNAGFLEKPGDFFTDPEAKKRAKIWLRYAVARYGASPAIFGWELFNEVQWVDPIHIDHRWDEVESWHKEMADYVRSIDPYHHPITSSSELRPNFDSSLDYVQPHTYPNNILPAVMGQTMPQAKPGFFGEFGPGNMKGANVPLAVRDGLLGGLLANHAGSAMFWYWDAVEIGNLYSEFAIGRKVADLSGWSGHPSAVVADVSASTAARATYVFQPGGGWGPSTQTRFNLPSGATSAALNKLSSYVQGNAHRDMMAGPIDLNFSVPVESSIKIELGEISANGGSLEISVDNQSAFSKEFKKSDALAPVTLSLKPGTHRVSIVNNGSDWITLKRVSITNLAPGAQVEALGDSNWCLARLSRLDSETQPLRVGLSGLPLKDGAYELTSINLENGLVTKEPVDVKDSRSSLETRVSDEILIYKRSR